MMDETEVEIDCSVAVESDVEVPGEIVVAITDAFKESIGHMVDTRRVHIDARTDAEHGVCTFTFNYFEIPAPGNPSAGFVPPYRCREIVMDELRDQLPDGVAFEAKNQDTTVVFRE